MTKSEIMRRIESKIDTDTSFARDVEKAIEAENDYWLAELIGNVIGAVIEIASDVWDWITDLFN